MEKANNGLILGNGPIRSFWRKPTYPIICNIEGHLVGAKSEKTLAKKLSGLVLDKSKQYDVINSTGEGWLLMAEAMVLSPVNFLKRKWTKLEIVRLYNNRTHKPDPNEKPYSEKSLSTKRLEEIIRDLVDRLG